MKGRPHVVVGGLGYTGRFITRGLLSRGAGVRILTGHPRSRPNPFGGAVTVARLDFGDSDGLARALEGAAVLYNTYWIRFDRGAVTHAAALENTRALFAAARRAGVARIVHVSIANPSPLSPYPYYRGKAAAEQALAASGVSHAILRPTTLFGGDSPDDGILVNNIAFMLRRLPLFAVPGDGGYGVQPVHVEDLAALCVEAGERSDVTTRDAAGPERFSYAEWVRLIADAVGRRPPVVRAPPGLVLALGGLMGALLRDVLLTSEEIRGLMDGLLVSKEPPLGGRRFSDWVAAAGAGLGRRYASELARHYRGDG
jgi:NADH dehydrogenase